MAVVREQGRGRAKDYPPLMLAGLVLLLLLAALPSALNLPQTTPSETLEYAPVPPEDENTTPPAGNFSSLGLGSSAGAGAVGGDGGPGGPPDPAPLEGRSVKAPSTKRCVGKPPRQAEDPMAPPCVAVFNGDNGGATYQGVTREEVRVVIYFGGGGQECYYDEACEPMPVNKLYDLGQSPQEDDPRRTKLIRTWQRYFNERYQTYGRFVRLYVYYGSGNSSAESRRAAAGEILKTVKPFATLEYVYGNSNAYVSAMANRGVMSFGGREFRTLDQYREHKGLLWSFAPAAERLAEAFSSWLCKKAAPYPASFSGNAGQNGRPRVFGFLRTSNPNMTHYEVIADLVREKTEACGIRYAADATYPACPALNVGANEDEAAAAMALFQAEGVSTIVWPGCWEGQMSRTANGSGYYPEWLTADLRGFERSEVGAIGQDQNSWSRAWVVTPQQLMNADGLPVPAPCVDAYLSVDPELAMDTYEPNNACESYDDLRQLFTGIQVSGPKLTPGAIEKGFRAIPAKPSNNREQPSCYYEPGDYTCVKDAIAQWWDPTAAGANAGGPAPFKGFQGCYRVGDNGQRYLPGDWPEGDILTMKAPDQICNLSNQY